MRDEIIKRADEILKQGQERVTPEVGDNVYTITNHYTKQFIMNEEGYVLDWNDLPMVEIPNGIHGEVSYVTTFWGIQSDEFHVKWDNGVETIEGSDDIEEEIIFIGGKFEEYGE